MAAPAVFESAMRTMRGAPAAAHAPHVRGNALVSTVQESSILRERVSHPSRLAVLQGPAPSRPITGARRPPATAMSAPSATTFVTETVIAEGLRQADLAAAKAYGASVVEDGLDGKMLLRVESVDRVFGLVNLLLQREVGSVTPNFLRRVAALKV